MTPRKILAFMLACLSCIFYAQAHNKQPENGKKCQGERKFEIIVREDPDMNNTRGIRWDENSNNRGLFSSGLFTLYRSSMAQKFTTASTSIVGLGISALQNALRSHRTDWMQAIQKECSYTKVLPMQTDIVDFYKEPSVKGAMDPENIVFEGFGCRQTIDITDEQGQKHTPTVFYVFCSLRTDSIGRQRIANHTKFEVVVDSIYFNPYLCNLPNDSVTNLDHRIDFDFQKRKDLTFSLKASFTSSWMNEAIQIYRDQLLGEFLVTAHINESDIHDGVFTYSAQNPQDTRKKVSITGDSFIVPRSYVGTIDGANFTPAWGTGQYKVQMQVAESCSINQDFYIKRDGNKMVPPQKGKSQEWNDEWKEEWKKIKKRKPATSLLRSMRDNITTQFSANEWITTIIDPISTTIIQAGSTFINGKSQAANATSQKGNGSSQKPNAGDKSDKPHGN